MRKIHFLLSTSLIAYSLYASEVISGQVAKIADGDTLTILKDKQEQIKIRLFGIDAPEKKQAFGKKSGESLASLCAGEVAEVKIKSKDRYGRSVGIVYCRGIEANRHQVAQGLAWAYLKYSKAYLKEEQEAREAKRGLWGESNPIAPWDFRKKKK